MRIAWRRAPERPLPALITALTVALVAGLLLTGPAGAAGHHGPAKGARPGKPTATSPAGIIATTTPTFTWSKAKGASKYELRV